MAVSVDEYKKLMGIERCDFDDECEICLKPQGGSFAKLIHNPEDVTETDYYICGNCIEKAAAKFELETE